MKKSLRIMLKNLICEAQTLYEKYTVTELTKLNTALYTVLGI